jgi:hypothetical protein
MVSPHLPASDMQVVMVGDDKSEISRFLFHSPVGLSRNNGTGCPGPMYGGNEYNLHG